MQDPLDPGEEAPKGKKNYQDPWESPFLFPAGGKILVLWSHRQTTRNKGIYIFKNTKSILRLKVESNKIRID